MISPRTVGLGINRVTHRADIQWTPGINGNHLLECTFAPRRHIVRNEWLNLDIGFSAYQYRAHRDFDTTYYDLEKYEFYGLALYPYWRAGDTMKRYVTLGFVGVVLIVGARVASAQVASWQVDGQTREAIVYAPAAAQGEEGVPLVLSFHGFGDNMQNFQHTNLHLAWPDAIIVYFQGLETRRGLRGWQVERSDVDRDLRLVDEALTSLQESYNIDEDRIYATGFSNGGMFTYLLWAERPGVFAAYAPVAARLRPSVRPTQPRPVFHVGGERDGVVRFADQGAAIEVAIEVNGVGEHTTSCGEGCTIYGSDTDAPVMTWIHGGAHVYPQGTSERIVSFFRGESRTNQP